MNDRQKKLPAGGTTFSAGGFGVAVDGFFSSGGDTLEYKIPKVTNKRTEDMKVMTQSRKLTMKMGYIEM